MIKSDLDLVTNGCVHNLDSYNVTGCTSHVRSSTRGIDS